MKQFSAIAGATTLVLLSTATLMGQSLGELARREEARRLSIAQASKVYTNQDLRVEVAPSRKFAEMRVSVTVTSTSAEPSAAISIMAINTMMRAAPSQASALRPWA